VPARLVLGLNQYTHSAAGCLLDADGAPLAMAAKERVSRKKHDGGDVADLVEHLLETAGAKLRDVALVAANNHLFRIDEFHRDLAWEVALDQHRTSYLAPHNLLPGVPRLELSHHLAHAWSVLPYLPFDEGLIVVMDGMGSTLRDLETPGEGYRSERTLPRAPGFREVRRAAAPPFGWREAETAYRFRGLALRPCFKRWTPTPKPEFLHNYGFAEMESLGAVYSRVASHVFGDWNACGKVMGLAPWAGRSERRPLVRGPLERLRVDWPRLHAEPHPHGWEEPRHRNGYRRLAADAQAGLEEVAVDFLRRLRRRTGARKLAFTGGVALNCVLNGRIARDCGFDEVFVPPWPGDEGVAVGCAAYAWHALHPRAAAPRRAPRAFQGREWSAADHAEALREFAPWIEVLPPSADEAALLRWAARALERGEVLGWFCGRAEFGPRALGHRSILADPRRADMVERLNRAVKKREAFRPFAPAVLAERAAEWFADPPPSPWMSFTARALPRTRRAAPAAVHVDGSARLQTLPPAGDATHLAGSARLRRLVEMFAERTGVPMLLNTSFNLRGEPMVESPRDALWTFLRSDMDYLVLESRVLRVRRMPALGAASRPCALPGIVFETTTSAAGECLSARAMARGETWDLAPLEADLLGIADGVRSWAEVAAALRAEHRAPAAEVRAAARRLWDLRLLSFTPAAASAARGRTKR
jgi:carbamoyltransferase